MTMTSRERVFTAVAHKETDRVPVDLFWQDNEVIEKLRRYLGVESEVDIKKIVGSDIAWSGSRSIRYPDYEIKLEASRQQFPDKNKNKVWLDDETFVDPWGTIEKFGSDKHYLQWVDGPLSGINTLEELEKSWEPPLYEYVQSFKDSASKIAEWKARDFVVIGGVSLPFKMAWRLRGMENFMMDMVANPEYAEYLLDKLYAHNTKIAVELARAGVDIISVVGDIGGQEAMLFSPRLFRKLMKPRYAAFVEAVKAVNPEVLVLNHSDGNVMAVVGDYIDIGVDILNPIQPECMDMPILKKKYGDNICFHGGISVQETVPRGSVQDVRAEVKSLIKILGAGGGYILSPSNVIPYDSPIENVAEIYRAAGSLKK